MVKVQDQILLFSLLFSKYLRWEFIAFIILKSFKSFSLKRQPMTAPSWFLSISGSFFSHYFYSTAKLPQLCAQPSFSLIALF